MTNGHKLFFAVKAIALAVVLAAFAQAQNPFETQKQFSATVVMSGMAAGSPMASGDMKIYRSGDKMRTSMGAMGYVVMDLTQHTNYMVMGSGMCMQMPTTRQQNPFAQASDATIDRSPAGTDTVDGHSCKVENLTVTGQSGKVVKMKVWEADDLKGFPIKVEIQSDKGPITVQYKDISFDTPPASMFTHPDNCRAMGTMGSSPQ
jgi:outer membrane lipoprotein-sorting protein